MLFATTTDDVKIAYAAVGEGRPVVIVHGLLTHIERGANSPSGDPYTPRLMHRHLVVRYDKRGCGLSIEASPITPWKLTCAISKRSSTRWA